MTKSHEAVSARRRTSPMLPMCTIGTRPARVIRPIWWRSMA